MTFRRALGYFLREAASDFWKRRTVNLVSIATIGASLYVVALFALILVNVGRGGLIDEDALIAALENRRIAMAGLDVYRMEPLPEASRLRELPNVVLLPHTAGGSYRSWEIDVPASMQNISRFFADGKAAGVINA